MQAQRALLSDGRWHFQHGPIDIVLAADGAPDALALAHQMAWQRFSMVLQELVDELPVLRQAMPIDGYLPRADAQFKGRVAQRMWTACAPYRGGFITPMAAVAGAVAQDLLAHYQRPGITRAWVNNGGDIAFHLTPGHSLRLGLFADLALLDDALRDPQGIRVDAQCTLEDGWPVRGVATSGWRGRSFSLGIADSVTVLAATAAMADAAATVVANAVNTEHDGIVRRPANSLRDDTDLGGLLVTSDVPPLPPSRVQQALAAGLAKAQDLQQCGLLWSATLVCQGQWAQTQHAQPLRSAVFDRSDLQLGSVFA